MRLRNDPNASSKLKQGNYLIDQFPVSVKSNTIVELGMGKGEMITQLAKENPNTNYIGIEKYETVAAKAAKRAEELKLKNFKIICQDINQLETLIKGEVKVIWLTFSDPWPKARHAKRRLTYKTFLDKYATILQKDGVIRLKTDNDKLFQYSLESFLKNNWKLKNITNDFHKHLAAKNNVMTGYEKKWSEAGKNINYLEAYKIN